MYVRQVQVNGARLAQHPLLHVKLRQPLHRPGLLGSQFGYLFIDRDRFRYKAVRQKQFCQPLEIFQRLERFPLANVEVANGHQRDLVSRLVLQDILIFGNGLRHLILVEILLRALDMSAFVIGH